MAVNLCLRNQRGAAEHRDRKRRRRIGVIDEIDLMLGAIAGADQNCSSRSQDRSQGRRCRRPSLARRNCSRDAHSCRPARRYPSTDRNCRCRAGRRCSSLAAIGAEDIFQAIAVIHLERAAAAHRALPAAALPRKPTQAVFCGIAHEIDAAAVEREREELARLGAPSPRRPAGDGRWFGRGE